MHSHLKILEKYNIDQTQYRTSSLQKLSEILAFCEEKGVLLLEPFIVKKGQARNNYICYSCNCGNEAQSPADNFLKKKVFACKKCNAKLINQITKPISTSKIKKEIEDKGYEIVSHNHQNNITDSLWTLKCKNGHTFQKKGGGLKTMQSCPECFVDSHEEFLFRKLIEGHFNTEFPKSHPEWLVNSHTNRVLELDLYSKALKLAFEYNGVQHYEPIYGQDRYLVSLRNDKEKKQRCLENNVKLISIKHMSVKILNKKVFLQKIAEKLKDYNIFISHETINSVSKVEYNVTNKTDLAISELKSLLKKHQREWISGVYSNSSSKINVKCLKCNTEKETSIHTLMCLKNKKVTKCSKCKDRFAIKKDYAIKRHTAIVKKICKKMNFIFDEFQYNTYGHISGFWHVKGDNKILFGIKQYRRVLKEEKSQ